MHSTPPPEVTWSWQQFATAALGITAMIAGGFMMHTPAGAPLIAAGGTLVGIAIPWPKKVSRL